VPSIVHGALVSKVEEDSNAAEAGLARGDVIIEVNRQPVRTSDEAVAMSEKGQRRAHPAAGSGAGGEGGRGCSSLLGDNANGNSVERDA